MTWTRSQVRIRIRIGIGICSIHLFARLDNSSRGFSCKRRSPNGYSNGFAYRVHCSTQDSNVGPNSSYATSKASPELRPKGYHKEKKNCSRRAKKLSRSRGNKWKRLMEAERRTKNHIFRQPLMNDLISPVRSAPIDSSRTKWIRPLECCQSRARAEFTVKWIDK